MVFWRKSVSREHVPVSTYQVRSPRNRDRTNPSPGTANLDKDSKKWQKRTVFYPFWAWTGFELSGGDLSCFSWQAVTSSWSHYLNEHTNSKLSVRFKHGELAALIDNVRSNKWIAFFDLFFANSVFVPCVLLNNGFVCTTWLWDILTRVNHYALQLNEIW